MALQPYELDIRVTWDEIPSRDDYLAAKQRAWAREDSAATASIKLNARIRLGCERPWLAPRPAQLDTLAPARLCFRNAGTPSSWSRRPARQSHPRDRKSVV